ncbi:MAG TPA: bifunctional transaldolase/phosoglucose isomerase [Melioribacteraceae bacterium]|nr:bifunctional transaldolase/phosoglucose isomerase [Melioribacteraceae bacterium]
MTKLEKLSELGQSIWYDFIEREFVTGGKLKSLIDDGLRGITSNPSIFEKAISTGKLYDSDIENVITKTTDTYAVYEYLALKDIENAADLMIPVYERTNGLDGYVSIEVNPDLAYENKKTFDEAVRLFTTLKRKNIMIKVPATNEGIEAVEELIAHGINVNVTLIFSIENYKKVAAAYISGLEKLLAAGGKLNLVSSVASFFVSRLDSTLDKMLEEKGATDLLGKFGVANSKLAYKYYQELYSSPRWKKLEENGARPQRLLWASTGTKNKAYSDTLYVDELIGFNTVNTVPPATLNSFINKGIVEERLTKEVEIAEAAFNKLIDLGISIDEVTNKLQLDGINAFIDSFNGLLNTLSTKINKVIKNKIENVKYHNINPNYINNLTVYVDEKISEKIWDKDYTIWSNSPTEITNRLGWLEVAEKSKEEITNIQQLTEQLIAEGIDKAVLLGMGGSSLAPEVFAKTFGKKEGYLDLSVLDSTHPEMVLNLRSTIDFEKTVFIVSTKSGGTVETFSFMKYFYNEVLSALGIDRVGNHFIAITDPGSGLEAVAIELNFRKIFLNDPNIGGRFSALSLFGMVPAGLIGVDLNLLLSRVSNAINCSKLNNLEFNTGLKIGALVGKYAKDKKDKLTFILSENYKNFGVWAEQLIAESTGKFGNGVLPIEGEPVYNERYYSEDRVFVYIHTKNEIELKEKVEVLINLGAPVIECITEDIYDLGAEFYRWEFATAVMGVELKLNPFDQPNVESAKIVARAMVKEYQETGKITELNKYFSNELIDVCDPLNINKIEDIIPTLMKNIDRLTQSIGLTPYLAIQAYLNMSDDINEVLQGLRNKITETYKIGTTLGYGPRFLHSTGQLHKGDAGNGIFLQIIDETGEAISIPDNAGSDKSSISFGVLVRAQALGDRKALLDNNRTIVTIIIKKDIKETLLKL